MNQPYGQQYPGQQPFPGGGQPQPGQQPYPGQPYPGQPMPGQPMPGQPYQQPTQPYQQQPSGGFPAPGPQSGGFPAQQPPPGAYPGGPGGYQQPGFPPPPPGHGRLMLDTSFFPLAFILHLFKPTLTINGRPGPIQWGQTPIDLPPGQYHVKVHFRYIFMDAGPAEATIPIAEGQTVPVFYKAPAIIFMGGAMGPAPQDTPGLVPMFVIMGVAFLFAFLVGLLPLMLL
ncbi:hypothetical protein JOF53_005912 [Crossiella equi]|uniref:Uncharacterized protein n=1 Tax=Crossiella equi TaxID=130796 RepID=A0ABS5AMW7_9PSEU|nr:hypothetical protein [Crossiella equi]MBP2477040.1 hypothetical protein [Crossiella equi]